MLPLPPKRLVFSVGALIIYWSILRMTTKMSANTEEIQALVKCYNFAATKHANQRRKDPEQTPYINHPIGVAQILSEAGITDVGILQAAVLHDTVEDTDTTFNEIEEQFGKRVRKIVDEVTDDKTLPKLVRKQLQIDHAKDSSYEAKLVKLADKIYNLRDLQRTIPTGWTEQRRTEYFQWSKKVVDNLRETNAYLENILDDIFKQQNLL